MKKLILAIAVLLLCSANALFAQVGIGTLSPDGSAMLDVSSSTMGFLMPRMTSSPVAPAAGLMYLNSSAEPFRLNIYTGSSWKIFAYSDEFLPLVGGTLSGHLTMATNARINTAASTTSTAGLRLPHGAAPTTPVNGDIWTSTTGVYARINGTTVGPLTGNTGTVTSVGLALPTQFSVTGSPVSASGTLTGSWNNQSINTVLSGPSSGSAGTPTFRVLVDNDIPNDITASNYLPLSGGTLTGDVTMSSGTQLFTAASATGGAGLRVPHGAAPTTPVNGDLWTTTAGVYARINGSTVGPLTANTGTVTTVTASLPISSSGGTSPNITIQQANSSQGGYLSSTDWTAFNGKENALTFGNGLGRSGNTISLGGSLTANTTITQGAYNLIHANTGAGSTIFNLSSSGDFIIQDAGTAFFTATDGGNIGIGISNPDSPLEIGKYAYTNYGFPQWGGNNYAYTSFFIDGFNVTMPQDNQFNAAETVLKWSTAFSGNNKWLNAYHSQILNSDNQVLMAANLSSLTYTGSGTFCSVYGTAGFVYNNSFLNTPTVTIGAHGSNDRGEATAWAVMGAGLRSGGNHAWTNTSDMRLKKNIHAISNPLDLIMRLNGVVYEYKQEDFSKTRFPQGPQIGFIAQEVKQVLPEAVQENCFRFEESSETYSGMTYETIIPVLVEAVKQQQNQISEQQRQIEEQQKLIQQLLEKMK